MSDSPIFQREKVRDVWQEGAYLVAANQRETGFLTLAEFNPDPAFYFGLEDKGLLRLYTMRIEGKLVGYQLFLVMANPDHPGALWGTQKVTYVTREHRGLSAAHFLGYAHDELRKEGVKFLIRNVREGHDYSGLLEHMGFQPLERSFVKDLSHGD